MLPKWSDADSVRKSSSAPSSGKLGKFRSMSEPSSGVFEHVDSEERMEGIPRYDSWQSGSSRRRVSNSIPSHLMTQTFTHKARARTRTFTAVTRAEPISCRTLILWAIFGTSGWWSSNAIFAQLPLLVKTLPEGDTLGNTLSAMTQLGNLFMVAYMVARRHLGLDPAALVCGLQIAGTIALVACAFVCSSAVLPSKSFPLIVLTVVTGGIGCISGVHYWTFLLLFPARCSVGASVGMALGGVICNMLAALQLCGLGESEGPRFSPGVFFLIAAVLQLLSIGIFILLQRQARPSNCASATEFDDGDSALDLLGDERADGLPKGSRFAFPATNAINRGIVYLMPTLMPYTAAAYPLNRTQILFRMLVCQQAGETIGRGLEPSDGQAIMAAILALLTFAAFAAGAIYPTALAGIVPDDFAPIVIPAACMYFFISYGMFETTIFKRIRGLSKQQQEVEDLSAMTGSWGQVGCFSSTVMVYLGFQLHALMANEH